MGFLGVKTYRKRLTGAVRSFLSYSKVISGPPQALETVHLETLAAQHESSHKGQ